MALGDGSSELVGSSYGQLAALLDLAEKSRMSRVNDVHVTQLTFRHVSTWVIFAYIKYTVYT